MLSQGLPYLSTLLLGIKDGQCLAPLHKDASAEQRIFRNLFLFPFLCTKTELMGYCDDYGSPALLTQQGSVGLFIALPSSRNQPTIIPPKVLFIGPRRRRRRRPAGNDRADAVRAPFQFA